MGLHLLCAYLPGQCAYGQCIVFNSSYEQFSKTGAVRHAYRDSVCILCCCVYF